jgi:hypothetical protein
MTTHQTCYYCKKDFKADPVLHQIGDESWLCDECAEELVKSGVIEDGYGLIPPPTRSECTDGKES